MTDGWLERREIFIADASGVVLGQIISPVSRSRLSTRRSYERGMLRVFTGFHCIPPKSFSKLVNGLSFYLNFACPAETLNNLFQIKTRKKTRGFVQKEPGTASFICSKVMVTEGLV